MPPLPFDFTFRVGYADTDKMGFLHHARYFAYLESARVELLRQTGESYRQWEERGILLPVVEANIRYAAPAFYDDVVLIRTSITRLTRLHLNFQYDVHCPERKALLATAATHHVFMDPANRPMRVAVDLLEKLRPWFQVQTDPDQTVG